MCAFVVLLFEEFSYPYESSLAFCQDKLVLSTAHSLFFCQLFHLLGLQLNPVVCIFLSVLLLFFLSVCSQMIISHELFFFQFT